MSDVSCLINAHHAGDFVGSISNAFLERGEGPSEPSVDGDVGRGLRR